jgi:hypothetical protein
LYFMFLVFVTIRLCRVMGFAVVAAFHLQIAQRAAVHVGVRFARFAVFWMPRVRRSVSGHFRDTRPVLGCVAVFFVKQYVSRTPHWAASFKGHENAVVAAFANVATDSSSIGQHFRVWLAIVVFNECVSRHGFVSVFYYVSNL